MNFYLPGMFARHLESMGWFGWLMAASIGLALCGYSCVALYESKMEMESFAVDETIATAEGRATAEVVSPRDFSARMPAPISADVLLSHLQAECQAAQMQLLRFAAVPAPTAPLLAQLKQLDYELTLRGEYVAIKQVLKAVVDRHPHVTVQQLRLQRHAATSIAPGQVAELEAAVRLRTWGRPVSPSLNAASAASESRQESDFNGGQRGQ